MSKDYLSRKNEHPRDKFIRFTGNDTGYVIGNDPNMKYTRVTSWNHSHFPEFEEKKIIDNIVNKNSITSEYYNMTHEEIKSDWKKSNELGTTLHEKIEKFMNTDVTLKQIRPLTILSPLSLPLNNIVDEGSSQLDILNIHIGTDIGTDNNDIAWRHFKTFVTEYPNLKPYRTEWLVYDEILKIAGSIDMIYENDDGTLEIYDWKRSKNISYPGFGKFAITDCIKHLPDCNYIHYSLQLHTYKMILETKYDKKVTAMYLVRLHPNGESYDRIPVIDLSVEVMTLAKLRISQLYPHLI